MQITQFLRGDETQEEVKEIINDIVETAIKQNKEIVLWLLDNKYKKLVDGLGVVKREEQGNTITAFAFNEAEDFNI